jgi:cytochrome o ubiquinol oxidase subunit II
MEPGRKGFPMPGARYNQIAKLLPLAATLLLGGCNWGVLDPQGPIGEAERSLILESTVLMLIIVVPVIVLVVAFAWRYRASNINAKYMPDWERSTAVAAVMVLAPVAIVSILAVSAWESSHRLDPFKPIESDAQPVAIDVVALDWKWLFIYPQLRVATVNEIAFPTDVPVDFRITSASVMNSFFIPQLGSQIYAMGGMQTKLSLMASRAGRYAGLSANYSGGGFSDMKFQAIASDQPSYERWVAKVKAAPQSLTGGVYLALATPSEKHPVEYFSSVAPDLFDKVLHGTRHAPAAAAMLGAAVCVANKE